VAQNASTKFGGEALLPLNYFSILRSRQIEILLVVQARTQAELKALFPAIGRSNALSDTWLHRLLNNWGRFIPARVNEFTFLSKAAAGQVHFIFLGRLIDWKAVDLLQEAFAAAVAQTDAVLEIIGDGDIQGELEAQTARLGIDSSVVFSGWLSHEQCALKLQQADALVLPSLPEGGGAVVLEVMAVGLPVIATNWAVQGII
jgi:glycosyltransferase involved in cell wall biosynthesis